MILEVLLSTLPSLDWIHAFLFVTKSLLFKGRLREGRLREGEALWQKQGWLPRAVAWLSCDIS